MTTKPLRPGSHGKEWLIRLSTVVVALGIAVALNFLGQNFAQDQGKLLLALLNFAISASVGVVLNTWYDGHLTRQEVKRSGELHQQILQKLSSTVATDAEFIRLATQYGGREITSAAEVYTLWHELCWLIEKDYCATNYIDKIYDSPWAPSALEIQSAKVRAGAGQVTIRKIFVYDSSDEKTRKRSSISRQKNLQLREVLVSELAAHQETKAILDKCGGAAKLDFGIFDSRYLLIWHLDANRCVVGGRLVFDQAEIRSYSNIFSQLWTVAKDLVQPIS
jgi:hypothetical protein